MDRLNYHHLLYFWIVAREGGLVPAGRVLRLSHPTLSAQIHALEEHLGEKLFTRVGRRLVLTESGQVAFGYAEQIFSLGGELVDNVRGRGQGHSTRLHVGISDVVPKYVVARLLQPALDLPEPVRLVCYEDSFEKLLADLALHKLDLVIADAPLPPGSVVRAYNHLLGETDVSFFARPEVAQRLRRGFPKSLDGVPMLLPLEGHILRRSLSQWMSRLDIKPRIMGEFEDSALLKVFGARGLGVFPAPTVVEKEVVSQYRVQSIGRVPEVLERFYVISAERRLKHPAVVAISQAAREKFFVGA